MNLELRHDRDANWTRAVLDAIWNGVANGLGFVGIVGFGLGFQSKLARTVSVREGASVVRSTSDSPAPPRPLGGCRSPSVCLSPSLFFFSLLSLCFSLLRWRLCSPEARRFRSGGALLEDGSPFVVSGSSAHVGISVRWFFPCFGGVISESTVGEALECLSSGSLSSYVACGSCRSLGAELEPEVCESLVSLFLLCSLPVVSSGNAFGPSEVGSQLALVVVSWQRVDDGDSTACVCGWAGVGRVSAQWKDINLASGFLTCLVDASLEEVFSTGLTTLMSLAFNGCTGSWVGGLEAAVFGYLLRTTASSVAEPSSCCRSRVFQGLRALFSPVARGDWLFILSMLRLLVPCV
ncbi:hypothetical protein DY000_02013021 [Brassica cretica]|uniref:Transmembrane protein n=1 Tax=Brassica cretica TaxID=69181 RepID=A0ABQ7D4R2_BRACR|nr:hypothetical protein DY000_02013021 [Brassica cretica]